MKILRPYSYTYPENVAASHLCDDLNYGLMKKGIYTEAYAPVPSRGLDKATYEEHKKIKYLEQFDGTQKIYRFSMFREGKNPIQRALRYMCCFIVQYRKGKKAKEVDLIHCSSTPPTQGILCGKIKKKLTKKYGRNVPFVYNLQDIFPDSLVTTGMTKKGSLLWKIGRKIENYTYNNADKIIVISQSMKRNIMEKGVPEEKIVVVSNWIDTDLIKPVPKESNKLFSEFGIPYDKFIVLYAGNFGAAQGAYVVVKAAEQLKNNGDIHFVIFGGGAEFEKAKAEVNEKVLTNVTINPLLPPDRISEVYSVGDVALITCKKGVGTSGMPSKTWSIMACNTPIIAAFDTDSELAEIIDSASAGVCIEPENAELLANEIIKASKSNVQCKSRDYVMENASKEKCVAKYVDVLMSQIER